MLTTAHKDNYHEGTEYVRRIHQQVFWIMGLRSALKSIKNKFHNFGKDGAQPKQPEMADLPHERVNGFPYSFKNIGIDYFGLFEVRILLKTLKYWCCVFTCLTTRASHFGVAQG